VLVVIALIVTPEGFPPAYEVMPGNTSHNTTLKAFLEAIQKQHGKAQRIWVMDRGIPTEATLEQMRQSDPPVLYPVAPPVAVLARWHFRGPASAWNQPWPPCNSDALPAGCRPTLHLP